MELRPGIRRPDLRSGDGGSSVLVAVNGRVSGWQALDWAAAECAANRFNLRVVHVVSEAVLALDPMGGAALTSWRTVAYDHGARILDEAAQRARLVAPDVAISTHLEAGAVASVIRKRGRDDVLIVVGRGRSTWSGVCSTGSRIVLRSRVPVASIELDGGGSSGCSAGRIVLGIDELAGPSAAVLYAFRAASRRGVGLTVIHGSASRHTRSGHVVDEVRKLAAIDDALGEYGEAFPEVNVRRRFATGEARRALVAESQAAALLVVGARSARRLPRVRLSAIARGVLRWANCPVAIIPSPRPAGLAPAADRPGRRRAGSVLRTVTDG